MTVDFEGLANGLLILITGLLAYFGVRKGARAIREPAEEGREATKPPPSGLMVAGALIDSKKADEVIKALDRHSLVSANQESAIRENTSALATNSDRLSHVRDDIDELRRDIHELTKEMVRGKG